MPSSVSSRGPSPSLPQRSQEVARELEGAILSGKYAVGQRLPSEEKLGKQFRASRTVIREAIQQLTSRGIVNTRVGSGSYVIAYDADNLGNALNYYSVLNADSKSYRELFDLRLLIETECLRRLAATREEQALSRVWEPLERMHRNLDAIGPFAAADIAFHRALVDSAGNHLFSALMSALQPLLQKYNEYTYVEKSLVEKNLREHQEIFEAIRSGNGEAAILAMRNHLRDSLAHFDSMLQSKPAPAAS